MILLLGGTSETSLIAGILARAGYRVVVYEAAEQIGSLNSAAFKAAWDPATRQLLRFQNTDAFGNSGNSLPAAFQVRPLSSERKT